MPPGVNLFHQTVFVRKADFTPSGFLFYFSKTTVATEFSITSKYHHLPS